MTKSYGDACKTYKHVQKLATVVIKSQALVEHIDNLENMTEEQTVQFNKLNDDVKAFTEQVDMIKGMLRGMKKFIDNMTSASSK